MACKIFNGHSYNESDLKQMFNGQLRPKAPNGKPSILWDTLSKEYSGTDLFQVYYKTTTKEFHNWFKGSKAVDANGEPLVVFHGTESKDDFTVFREGQSGIFFTDDKQYALDVKSNNRLTPTPYYLKIEKPIPVSEEIDNDVSFNVKSIGDGIIGVDWGQRFSSQGNTFVVYNSNQIKSVENLGGFSESKDIFYQKPNEITDEIVASEKTIRDLAYRMADRIGMNVRFESDRTKNYKGKLEGDTAVINLANASLDTPIHEILGHPIIRAIKNRKGSNLEMFSGKIKYDPSAPSPYYITLVNSDGSPDYKFFETKKEAENWKNKIFKNTSLYSNLLKELEYGKGKEVLDRIKKDYVQKTQGEKYTLEEQQEEAIVELLGLYTAKKLDNVKDGKLISLLKRLLKSIKSFIKDLLKQREVNIDELPDNMTLGDLSDLLAYSNSKLILPGYEVVYTTPDNQKFKTYAEASNHISKLFSESKDVDLSNVSLTPIKNINEIPKTGFTVADELEVFYENNNWKLYHPEQGVSNLTEKQVINYFNKNNLLSQFIEKNKEYEQSQEIIEEWKKVNNIQYNPEEIYSRGQEFISVVGAYSNFDVNLMMQNLLSHIEDNRKAGGKFAISAFTRHKNTRLGHIEGVSGKIRFKIYPKPEDILWAADADVYSGSVWDASKKVNKDKKSELIGVSYSKYPKLNTLSSVQPNLADITDKIRHSHNELGLVLTGDNFRLEFDEDIPYSTKRILRGINRILDQKYGKLVKPNIEKVEGRVIQPTQTKENLKLSLEQIQTKIGVPVVDPADLDDIKEDLADGIITEEIYNRLTKGVDKEYNNQALVNTKVSALKEVAKKYPRILISSEVKPINQYSEYDMFDDSEDLPFQKVRSETKDLKQLEQELIQFLNSKGIKAERIDAFKKRMDKRGTTVTVKGFADMLNKIVGYSDTVNLIEEVAHMMVDMYVDTNSTIYKLVEEHPMYKKVKEEYKDVYNTKEQFLKETLGKLVKQSIIDKNNSGISGRLSNRIKYLWNKFVDMVRGFKGLDTYLTEIVSATGDKFDPERLGEDILYELDKNQFVKSKMLNQFKKTLEDAIKIKTTRYNVFKEKSKIALKKKESAQIRSLTNALENDKITYGIVEFLQNTSLEADSIVKRFTNYLENMEDRTMSEAATLLNNLDQFLDAYKPILLDIRSDLNFMTNLSHPEMYNEIKNTISSLVEKIEDMETRYKKVSLHLTGEMLHPFIKNSSNVDGIEDVIKMLQSSDDIGLYRKWLNSMQNSGDDILAALDKYVRLAKEKVRLQTEEDSKIILIADKKLRENGVKSTEWIMEKINGVPTGNYISKFNREQWKREYNKQSKKLIDKYNLPDNKLLRNIFTMSYNDYRVKEWMKDGKIKVITNRIQKKNGGIPARELRELVWEETVKAYRRDWAKWHSVNTQVNDRYVDLIKNKLKKHYDDLVFEADKKDILDKAYEKYVEGKNINLGKLTHEEKLAFELFQEWLDDVRRYSNYQKDYYYVGELSQPSNKYLNKEFDNIINDPIKKEYYDLVLGMKRDKDAKLPSRFTDEYRMPQIRKDLVERLKQDPKSITKEVADNFRKKNTDVGFGQLDEEGNKLIVADTKDNPVKFIPVYYTNPIEDIKELSTDATTGIMLYAQMSNNYAEMDKIVDTLQMSKNVLSNRKIKLGTSKLSVFNELFTGQPVVKETTGGNAYDRFVEFLNMNVFGESKAKESNRLFDKLGLDQAKVVDAFNKYTSIQGLAFNVYSAVANPILGNALLRQEGFAKQYATHKDFLKADIIYSKNLRSVIKDIGKNLSTSKLRLFGEYINLMQDYEHRIKDTNADRSRFGRMMNMSNLFFMNHLGEHQIQNRLALAMANNKKVKLGDKEMSLWEALRVENHRLIIPNGLKNLDGTDFTQDDLIDFGLRVQYLNQNLHGIYNEYDKAMLQKWSLGRAALLFRKFIVPGINRRWGKRYYHIGLDSDVEGMYITTGRFFYGLIKELKEYQWNYSANWDKLSDFEKQNIKRTYTELTYMLAASILMGILTSLSDDDDDNQALAFVAVQANRMYSELRFYSSWEESLKLLQSPAAGIRQLTTLGTYLETFDPYGAMFNDKNIIRRFERGKEKGNTYIWVATKKSIPLVQQIDKWTSPDEVLKFYSR